MDTNITELSSVVATSNQVSGDLLEGEAVILSLKDGVYYGLDPVGNRIWQLIQKPTSVKEVRDTLLQEYDVDTDRCTRELLDLLKEMATKGLIEVRNGISA